MTGIVLILGSTGRFGRNASEAFWNAGWQVRLFDRATDDLMDKALGVDVIVNGWHPAYPDWADQTPKLTQDIIAAAQWSGASVLIPGNVYVYGDEAPGLLSPDTPHAATNPLGKVRIEMEAAYRASGVRTIILRAGDFIDTQASGNWFDKILAPGLAKGRLTYPGPLDVPHAWAFLPDLAKAAVDLCAIRDQLPDFADVPYAGYTLTAQQMADAASVAFDRKVTARRMSWVPLQMVALVSRLFRCMCEMRFLWSMPHALDPAPMRALLPNHQATPLPEALAQAVPDLAPAKTGQQVKPRSIAPKAVG